MYHARYAASQFTNAEMKKTPTHATATNTGSSPCSDSVEPLELLEKRTVVEASMQCTSHVGEGTKPAGLGYGDVPWQYSIRPHAVIPFVSAMNAVSRLISSSLKSVSRWPDWTNSAGSSL